MKASAFSYTRATSVINALELLAAHGDGAKVLSGGQSLMPAMNLRLVSPELIVDIGELAELRGIERKGDILRIGALTRHVELQRSSVVARHAPLLTQAMVHGEYALATGARGELWVVRLGEKDGRWPLTDSGVGLAAWTP